MYFQCVARSLIITAGLASFVNGMDFKISVNEILADNEMGIVDEEGKNEDWAELYNDSDMDMDLSGYFLTDDESNPQQWAFPEGTMIAGKGFLLVWCDDDEDDGPLHANFKLSKDGEGVFLVDSMNETVSCIEWDDLGDDESYGRVPDGGTTLQEFSTPTPEMMNIPNMITLVIDGAGGMGMGMGSLTLCTVGATPSSFVYYVYDTMETEYEIDAQFCNGSVLDVDPTSNTAVKIDTGMNGMAALPVPPGAMGEYYVQVIDSECMITNVAMLSLM